MDGYALRKHLWEEFKWLHIERHKSNISIVFRKDSKKRQRVIQFLSSLGVRVNQQSKSKHFKTFTITVSVDKKPLTFKPLRRYIRDIFQQYKKSVNYWLFSDVTRNRSYRRLALKWTRMNHEQTQKIYIRLRAFCLFHPEFEIGKLREPGGWCVGAHAISFLYKAGNDGTLI